MKDNIKVRGGIAGTRQYQRLILPPGQRPQEVSDSQALAAAKRRRREEMSKVESARVTADSDEAELGKIIMLREDGHSVQQIADAFGASLAWVASRIHRIRKAMERGQKKR